MDRKLQERVLRNGPTTDSQEEADCAAWLIKHGLADGDSIPDGTRSGGHTASVIWLGPTPAGLKAIANSNIILRAINSKWGSGIAIGLIVGFLLFFILRPFVLPGSPGSPGSGLDTMHKCYDSRPDPQFPSAARCGVVHSYSAESKLSRNNEAKEIIYSWGNQSPEPLQNILKNIGHSAHVIHVETLVSVFKDGIRDFLEDVGEDQNKVELVVKRAAKLFKDQPKEFWR